MNDIQQRLFYSDFGFWPLNHSAFRRVLDIRHLVTELSTFLLPKKYLLLHFVFLSKVEFYKALVLSFVFHFSLAPNGCKKKKKSLPPPPPSKCFYFPNLFHLGKCRAVCHLNLGLTLYFVTLDLCLVGAWSCHLGWWLMSEPDSPSFLLQFFTNMVKLVERI